MPNIPTYQPGQAQNRPMPGLSWSANASARSFGGADAENLAEVGQGMQRAGLTGAAIAGDVAQWHNLDVAREAISSARQELNAFSSQEFQKQGREALGASQRIGDFGRKIAETRLKGLNGSQQEIFNRVWPQYADSHVMRAQGFEAQQGDVYHKQTLADANQTTEDELFARMDDPEAVKSGLAEIGANTRAIYAGAGDVELRVKVAKEKALAAMIQQRAVSDSAGALVFLEAHQGELHPSWAMQVRRGLQAQVDDLMVSGHVMALSSAPGVDEAGAIAAVDKRTDLTPEQKEKVLAGIHVQFGIRRNAAAQAQQRATEGAWETFWKAPGVDTVARMQIPEAEKVKMREAMGKMTVRRSDAEQAAAYGKLLANPNLERINLFEHRTEMSAGQFDHLWDLQQKMRKGETRETANFKQGIAYARGMMADSSHFKGEDTRQAQMLAAFQSRLRALPDEERNDFSKAKAVFDDLMKDAVLNPGWFGMRETHWYTPGFMEPDTASKYRIESGEFPGGGAQPSQEKRSQAGAPGVPLQSTRVLGHSYGAARGEGAGEFPSPASAAPDFSSVTAPDAIVDFVKGHEGFTARAKKDNGQFSVGYGTRAVDSNEELTVDQAEVRLRDELSQHYARVMRAAESKGWVLTEDQAKALTSFDFNTGRGVAVLANAKGWTDVKRSMGRYVNSGGRKLLGLSRRREAEIALLGE